MVMAVYKPLRDALNDAERLLFGDAFNVVEILVKVATLAVLNDQTKFS